MDDIKVLLNGELIEAEQAKISLFDYGFLFGTSVYEVLKTVNGEVFAGELHLKRMRYSAEKVGIPIPWENSFLIDEFYKLVKYIDNPSCYIRLVVTRGVGPLTFHPSECTFPNRIVYGRVLHRIPDEEYEKGVSLMISDYRKAPSRHRTGNVKTGNFLGHVLPLHKARSSGYHEALMLNHRDEITECTTANIFWISKGRLYTPTLRAGVLKGVTRELVLSMAKEMKMDVLIGRFTLEDLNRADEVFITSTTRDILPVSLVGDKRFPVGEKTKALMAAIFKQGMKNVNSR